MKKQPSNNNPNQRTAKMNIHTPLKNQAYLEEQSRQRGLNHLKQCDFREVAKAFDEIFEDCSNDPVADQIRGMLYSNIGNQGEAIPLLRRAVERMPDEPEPKISLGIALLRNGDVDEAEKLQEEALAMEPDNTLALTNLAWTLLHRNKCPDRAEMLLRRADKIEPGQPAIWANMGHALLLQDRQQEACLALWMAIGLDKSGEACRNILQWYPPLAEEASDKLAELSRRPEPKH